MEAEKTQTTAAPVPWQHGTGKRQTFPSLWTNPIGKNKTWCWQKNMDSPPWAHGIRKIHNIPLPWTNGTGKIQGVPIPQPHGFGKIKDIGTGVWRR